MKVSLTPWTVWRSKIFPHSMESETSLPCSQEPDIGPYFEKAEVPNLTVQFLRSILILSFHSCIQLTSGFFPSGFPTKIFLCIYHFTYTCYVYHPFHSPLFDHTRHMKYIYNFCMKHLSFVTCKGTQMAQTHTLKVMFGNFKLFDILEGNSTV